MTKRHLDLPTGEPICTRPSYSIPKASFRSRRESLSNNANGCRTPLNINLWSYPSIR